MKKTLLLSAILLCAFTFMSAQEKQLPVVKKEFAILKQLPATPVKNQARTGTCWCFATTSFMESELLRKGKGEFDLSEMFIVRNNYLARMDDNYLRRGKGNLGEGSIAHNYLNAMKKAGLMPEEAYKGINYNSEFHDHTELNKFINSIAEVPVELKRRSPEYYKLLNSLLDIYLGPVPQFFTYKGKSYDPVSFEKSLGLNPDDYVEITSFSHAPFYTKFALEIPDNWDHGQMYNIPLDELMQVAYSAIENGYTLCWDGDVSEKFFSHKDGYAIVPADPANPNGDELAINQEVRQKGFENFTTTDDHLMHMTGIAKDEKGNKFFLTKNSWGTERNSYGGYLYISDNYFRAKCISILVHKDAVPVAIRAKLGF
jgi:bleomycin hydrolase